MCNLNLKTNPYNCPISHYVSTSSYKPLFKREKTTTLYFFHGMCKSRIVLIKALTIISEEQDIASQCCTFRLMKLWGLPHWLTKINLIHCFHFGFLVLSNVYTILSKARWRYLIWFLYTNLYSFWKTSLWVQWGSTVRVLKTVLKCIVD